MARGNRRAGKKPHAKHYIREWRKYRNLTQERLAERVELTAGAISQLETGIVSYTQPTLEALAEALNCTPGDLLSVNPAKEGQVIDLMRVIGGRDLDMIKRIISALPKADGTND